MKTSKKVLAIVLSVAMILSVMVFSISAVDFDETWKAVTTAAELKAIEDDLAGNYYLANDITLTGDWESIGWLDSGDAAFTGTFDGNGKTISGLSMNYAGSLNASSNVGLFAINAGTIKNLTVASASVKGSTQVGAIAGTNAADGVISNCVVSDSLVSGGFLVSTSQRYWLSDGYQVGAVAGLNKGTVEKCYNDETDVRGWYEVGGIVGHNSGVISECASTGDINSTNSGAASQGQISRFRYAAEAAARFSSNGVAPLAYGRAGGIVGCNDGSVSDVYVTAAPGKEFVGVAGFNSVGGVCGANNGTIKNAYSAHTQFTMPANGAELYYPNGNVGGYAGTIYSWANKYFHPLVGSQQSGETENSFYSEIVNGTLPSASFNAGGRGDEKTDDEMKNEDMYKDAGWDYDDVWTTDNATGLPVLKFLATDTDCKHENTEVVGKKDPTCTEPGYTGDTVCKDCGKVLEKGEEIPATGHHDDDKDGKCDGCGKDMQEVCDHENTEVVGKKDPTCTEPGYTGDTVCKDCGKVLEKGEEIPATGHHDDDKDGKCDGCGKDMQEVCDHENTEVVGKKDPTCGKPGYTGDTVCKDCGKVLEKGEEIPATGNHVWGEGVVTKDATCTEAGEKTYTCTVCGDTKTEVIPATGHDYQVVGKKDATCEEDGYTGDEVCKNCGDVKSTGSVIPAKGHNDANGDGKCDDCGKDIGGGSHDNGNTGGSHRFFDSLLNWFTRLMILVRHLLGMTA